MLVLLNCYSVDCVRVEIRIFYNKLLLREIRSCHRGECRFPVCGGM